MSDNPWDSWNAPMARPDMVVVLPAIQRGISVGGSRLVPAPCSGRGLIGVAGWHTPTNARRALAIHRDLCPDWTEDPDLVLLAAEQEDQT